MGKTVLVSDDDKRIVKLGQALLQDRKGCRLVQASDGTRALSVARKEKPDVALLDVRMPKKNGYEVCRSLKADKSTSRIKVIMLTGVDQKEVEHKGREVGADGYMTKAFKPAALLKKIGV